VEVIGGAENDFHLSVAQVEIGGASGVDDAVTDIECAMKIVPSPIGQAGDWTFRQKIGDESADGINALVVVEMAVARFFLKEWVQRFGEGFANLNRHLAHRGGEGVDE